MTFEDVTADPAAFAVWLDGPYMGLRWSGIAVVKSTHRILARCLRCGYRTGLVSGDSVAVVTNRSEDQAEIVSDGGRPFDFTGVHLTAGWRDGLEVQLEGLREGKLLHSAAITVGTAQATSFSFEFRGIDTLRIRTSGGADAGICDSGCDPGPEVVLDDFAFTFPREAAAIDPPPQSTAGEPGVAADSEPVGGSAVTDEPAPAGQATGVPEQMPYAAAGDRQTASTVADTPARTPSGAAGRIEPRQGSCHGIQVGAFESQENASRLRNSLPTEYGVTLSPHQHPDRGLLYRVVVGCTDRNGAEDLLRALQEKGIPGFVVQVDKPGQPGSR